MLAHHTTRIIYPLTVDADDIFTVQPAGNYVHGLHEESCPLCLLGICTQRVTRDLDGTLIVHARTMPN